MKMREKRIFREEEEEENDCVIWPSDDGSHPYEGGTTELHELVVVVAIVLNP